MLKDKAGNRLYRKVSVRIYYPDQIFPTKTLLQHAGPHMGFGPEGVDEILMRIADQLETLYPFWEFRAVELTPVGRTVRFSFTFAGYSTKTAMPPIGPLPPVAEKQTVDDFTQDYKPTESKAPGTEAATEQTPA